MVDDQRLKRSPAGFQVQGELFLKGSKERGEVGPGRVRFARELQRQVEVAVDSSAIEDHSTSASSEIARQQVHRDAAGPQVTNLTQLMVPFSEPVTGVNASDLLINGMPASSVSGSGTTYTFSFAQPNATMVNVTWAAAHGIRDLAVTPNGFNATAPGSTWFYSTPDNVPPGLASHNPPAGATVRSLLHITVVFS